MSLYKFETEHFGLSDKGIHLLRSRFNYETIEYFQIDSVIINKGPQVANWWLVLSLGLTFFLGGVYTIYSSTFREEEGVIGMAIEIGAIPVFFGAYGIFISIKRGTVLNIYLNGKKKSFPMQKLRNKRKAEELVEFLQNNKLMKSKMQIDM